MQSAFGAMSCLAMPQHLRLHAGIEVVDALPANLLARRLLELLCLYFTVRAKQVCRVPSALQSPV